MSLPKISETVHGVSNVKEDWMTYKLAKTWDKLFNHLTQYDFSKVDRVMVDTIRNDSAGLHYETTPGSESSTIIVGPYVFNLAWMTTPYTNKMIQGDIVLFVLLHEFAHHLQSTCQIETEEDREIQADNFAFETLKEMK